MLLNQLLVKSEINLIDFKIDYIGEIYSHNQTLIFQIKNLINSLDLVNDTVLQIGSKEIIVKINKDNEILFIKFSHEYSAKPMPLSAGLKLWRVIYAIYPSLNQVISHRLTDIIDCFKKICIEFSLDEIQKINLLNPKVNYIKSFFDQSNIDISDNYFIIREHLLLEKFNLLDALISLGMKPSNCWIITKEDKTTYFNKIYKTLEQKGFNIRTLEHRCKIDLYIQEIVKEIDMNKTIILDDGGELINAIYKIDNSYKNVKAIETTTKGIRLLETTPYIESVIDLANSSIKKDLSKEIAISCVVNLRNILQHKKMMGEYCHIIGFGKLGEHVALLLRSFGLNITVFDKSEETRTRAEASGFSVYPSTEKALLENEHKFVFCCTGSPSISVSNLSLLGEKSFLIALSSQDLKEVKIHLENVGEKTILEGIGDHFFIEQNEITLIAHGHAVNLYYSEGVSEPEYDDFTALMLLSVLKAANDTGGYLPSDIEKWCKLIKSIPLKQGG